ncbi:MAG: 30S ribosomal protein S4 [Chloroflexi bacterium]|nr:30S ribosomal protein S4 [Chloroflexota bacterium]
MARYIGPSCRICRRAGIKLFLKGDRCYTPKCAIEKRNSPPGPRAQRRRRLSDRGVQLREKQKARYGYGVMEGQFRRIFAEAGRQPGVTGESLVRLLEFRLDNIVYRLGFANSRKQARQLVQHGHLSLNGVKTNIPSCAVKVGDVIGWQDPSKKTEYYLRAVEEVKGKTVPNWLSLDKETMVGRVLRIPERTEVDTQFDEKSIVEFYSR